MARSMLSALASRLVTYPYHTRHDAALTSSSTFSTFSSVSSNVSVT